MNPVMSLGSQSARNPTHRLSAGRQFFGKTPQVFKTAVENALKAALPLSARSIQP